MTTTITRQDQGFLELFSTSWARGDINRQLDDSAGVQLNTHTPGNHEVCVDNTSELLHTPQVRKRGRPRKHGKTPQKSFIPESGENDEAEQTWVIGKMVGMHCDKEAAMVSAIRRSKRRT